MANDPLPLPATLLLAALERDDLVGAADQLTSALRTGVGVVDVLDEVVRPTMREVGRLWQTNRWTVAQEHGATATVDAALAALEARFPPLAPAGRPVVVACPEGEWHSLPARLATARLRDLGFHVIFLGPSLPPQHLADHLRRVNAATLGLSCSIPTNLINARASVQAAHEVGVPVVVGGAAFDPAGLRAKGIGADACDGADDVPAFLAKPSRRQARRSGRALAGQREAADLMADRQAVVDAAMADVALHAAGVADYDRAQAARIREDLGWIVSFAAAAVDLGDPSLFSDFTSWTREVLVNRSVPTTVVDQTLRGVQRVMAARFPQAARLVAEALAA